MGPRFGTPDRIRRLLAGARSPVRNLQQLSKNPTQGGVLAWYTRQDSNLRPLAPQANALSS